MARYTATKTTLKILNKENFPAYSQDAKTDLTMRVLTTTREPKFYGYDEPELIDLIHKVLDLDPIYVLKLAVYARNEFYLRSIPILLLVEYANTKPGEIHGARKIVPKIVRRADEIAEVLACQFERNKRNGTKTKMPNMLRYGLRDAFMKFDTYQLAKYRGEGRTVSLRDAMMLLHPTPPTGMENTYCALKEGTLVITEGATWERMISEKGSSHETWTEAAKVMPYMALLRNLRNLVLHNVDLEIPIKRLTNPEAVAKSKQLPFRFYSAYRELEKVNAPGKLLAAVSTALDLSVRNIPTLSGRTAIWVDSSGSMTMDQTTNRDRKPGERIKTIRPSNIACVLAAALYKANPDSLIGLFDTDAKFVSLNPNDTVMTNAMKLMSMSRGGATLAYKAMEKMNGRKVDRIVMLSDFQCYGEPLKEAFNYYCKANSPECKFVSIDIMGYGNSQFPSHDNRIMVFAGWSEKILKMMNDTSTGIVEIVEGYVLP